MVDSLKGPEKVISSQDLKPAYETLITIGKWRQAVGKQTVTSVRSYVQLPETRAHSQQQYSTEPLFELQLSKCQFLQTNKKQR